MITDRNSKKLSDNMPGRQSHGGKPSKKVKARTNNKKRSINAFAIASQQTQDKVKVRQHRLGEVEGGNRPVKRNREADDEDQDDEDSGVKKQKKLPSKGRFDQLDIDAGSDSEGNEWRLGHVDSDDDSDLDSDEAFGKSDEERFDGYAFSGGSGKGTKQKVLDKSHGITLDEVDSDMDELSGSDDDDLGEDAIDLAAMLDATEEDEDASLIKDKTKGLSETSEDDNFGEESDEESDEDSSNSSADEDDPVKLTALQNLIQNLPQTDPENQPPRQRSDGASEYNTPSDFGVTSKTKLTLEDLGLPSVHDPFVKKSLKILAAESKDSTKIPGKLAVPLAKRQQDRLDRSVAYEKSKETLDKWTDTVKHNRRAEHLIFPLKDQDAASMTANSRLQSTATAKPFNELEATIQSILEESGLASANGKDDEDKLREFEELETKKMSVEEVKARREQLRKARDLLFREEAKAKRIKKIKSKSYRKVHRKQREKEERMNKEALIEAGFEPSEDEQEAQDRRRATERMGDKHRGSKWAKATKATGRAVWDEDARAGIAEMARRDEELRKRVEGRASRRDDDSESSDSDSDDHSDGEENSRLLQKLDDLKRGDDIPASAQGSRLANMKFMLKADATRRKENDQTVEQIRRELAGEDTSGEEELDIGIGRRTFGLDNDKSAELPQRVAKKINEFEEPKSDDSVADTMIEKEGVRAAVSQGQQRSGVKAPSIPMNPTVHIGDSEGGAWSRSIRHIDPSSSSQERRRKQKLNGAADVDEIDITNASIIASQAKSIKKSRKNVTFIHADNSVDEEDSDEHASLPFAIRDQELIKRAFAGADVVGDFEAEKRQTIDDEEEKIIDNTIPGWGSWTGDGVSKREKQKNKGRFLTKSDGIKEQNRKDATLERVIINEKRVKKVCSNLCIQLTLLTNYRMVNTLLLIFRILSRLDSNTKDRCACLSAPNGPLKRHSKTPQSLEYCSSRASLHLCQSPYCNGSVVLLPTYVD
jgi:U3 small nucleolar RNA-associated protein 14